MIKNICEMGSNLVHKSFVYDKKSNTSEGKYCKFKMKGKHIDTQRDSADIYEKMIFEIF